MLTPSGRFVPGEDICLSASNYHPETWTPRWTILALVDALRLHMVTSAGEIGGMERGKRERGRLAEHSRVWRRMGVVDHSKMAEAGLFGGSREVVGAGDNNNGREIEEEGVVGNGTIGVGEAFCEEDSDKARAISGDNDASSMVHDTQARARRQRRQQERRSTKDVGDVRVKKKNNNDVFDREDGAPSQSVRSEYAQLDTDDGWEHRRTLMREARGGHGNDDEGINTTVKSTRGNIALILMKEVASLLCNPIYLSFVFFCYLFLRLNR